MRALGRVRASLFQPGKSHRLRYSSSSICKYASPAVDRLSPALLARARASATEHDVLAKKLASTFDASSAKRQGELAPVADALAQWEYASASRKELQSMIDDPSGDRELRELAVEDLDSADEQLATASSLLKTALATHHPFAALPCLLEIRPGVGGGEANLFAGDLLRMYQAFCSRRGLRAALVKYDTTEGVSDPRGSDGPLSEAILEISTPGAYGILRTEAGVHRVQRVPATESKGRVHTSAATVLVLPSFGEDGEELDDTHANNPSSDFYVYAPDVQVDTMRARGAGGQHVNTTDSAVRLTHKPTNTVVVCRDGRSQLQNRAKAWQILRARLAQARREAREEERLSMRRSTAGHGKSGRSDKIRTYNWSQKRVTDHRSGMTLNQLDGVIEGGDALDQIMASVQEWFVEIDLEDLVGVGEQETNTSR